MTTRLSSTITSQSVQFSTEDILLDVAHNLKVSDQNSKSLQRRPVMKKILTGPYAGRFCRASVLLIMCNMLESCSFLSVSYPLQKTISVWKTAGSPPLVSCEYPFEIETPALSGSTGPQAYPSMREFSKAVTAAKAPIWECGVIGGSDTSTEAVPNPAEIAKMDWGPFGYALLHTRHPGTALAYLDVAGWENWPVLDDPDTQYRLYGKLPEGVQTYHYETIEPYRVRKKISTAYGAWYLAYQRIPKDNAQATRQGAGLYAMQGFRCAIRVRDFPGARKYWALALEANPKFAPAYAQIALKVLFQIYYKNQRWNEEIDSDTAYLKIPQDIRNAVWDAVGQSYGTDGKLSMARAEEAAHAGMLEKVFPQSKLFLSSLYCPVFYPDFDPGFDRIADPVYYPEYRPLTYPSYSLKAAAERAGNQTGKNGKK